VTKVMLFCSVKAPWQSVKRLHLALPVQEIKKSWHKQKRGKLWKIC